MVVLWRYKCQSCPVDFSGRFVRGSSKTLMALLAIKVELYELSMKIWRPGSQKSGRSLGLTSCSRTR